jgi:tetratricopeptide (TPR) repeat protein
MHDFFRRVTVSETTYDAIRRGPDALANRFDHLIQAAAHFYANGRVPPSARIRHLDEGLYKLRLDRARRIPFYFSHEAGDPILHFGDIGSHATGVSWHTAPPTWGPDVTLTATPIEIEFDTPLPTLRPTWIGRVWNPNWDERARRNPDAQMELALDPDQRAIAGMAGPLLLQGGPGSGKTTIAVYRLLMGNTAHVGRQLYVTYTDSLRTYAEQQYDALAEPGQPKPLFLTIPDLCRRLIGPDHATRFPPDKRMTAALFKAHFFGRTHRTAGLDPDLAWEEIQAVIKGDPRLLADKRPHLSRDEYLQCRHRIADDPDAVYRLFETYSRSGYWDDLDLSREAFWRQQKGSSPLGRFDEIVVDEAQDLTGFQIGLLLALCQSHTGLFLAGDTQQAIHPSRFDWTRSRELLFRLWALRLPSDHIQTLHANYRNPAAIVDLCNAISRWREATWQDEPAECLALKDGPPIRILGDGDVPVAPAPDLITSRLMVIACDEAAKDYLQARFGAGIVFTVHEAKGLERDFVLVWRPFTGDRSRWDRRDYDDPHFVNMVNRLIVSLSRATEALFIVDESLPTQWPPLADLRAETGTAATTALRAVFSLEPDSETYIRQQAVDLERSGHLEQAAALYERVRQWRPAARCHKALQRLDDTARCLGWAGAHREAAALYVDLQDWRQAALSFHQAGDHAQAADCFLRGHADQEALPHLLAIGKLAEAAQCHERLANWREATELYDNLGRPADAARCHLERGDCLAAAEAFRQAGQKEDVAMCLEMAGQHEAAAAAYEAIGDWRNAGICLEANGELDQALKRYEKANAWWEAGHLMAGRGQFKTAARIFGQGDDPLLSVAALYRSGHIAAAAGGLEQYAAATFAVGGEVDPRLTAADVIRGFDDLGTARLKQVSRQWVGAAWLTAVACFRQAHDGASADRCQRLHDWTAKRDWLALAEHYAEREQPALAAGYYTRGGQHHAAAGQWEAALVFAPAAEAFGMAGDGAAAERCRRAEEAVAIGWGAVAAVYEKAELWAQAGRIHAKADNWQRAAVAWNRQGLLGLQRHLARLKDLAVAEMPLAPGARWPEDWEMSSKCFSQARDKINALRVRQLATQARAAVTVGEWQVLAKAAGVRS